MRALFYTVGGQASRQDGVSISLKASERLCLGCDFIALSGVEDACISCILAVMHLPLRLRGELAQQRHQGSFLPQFQ